MRAARCGMTLVELLVAIVIAVLLIAVVFATYRTAVAVRGGQQQRGSQTHAAAAALDQLQQDLMRAFIPPGDAACGIILTQNLGRAEISFCMMRPDPAETDLRWARVERVTVRADGGMLQTVVRPLSGPGSTGGTVTNALAQGVDRFGVWLYDGSEWLDQWPAADTNARAHAARIEIGTVDKKSWTTEVWIPAGTVFTSSFQRSASASQ